MPVKKDKRGRKKLEVKRDVLVFARFNKEEVKQMKKYYKENGFDNRSQLVRAAVLEFMDK